MAGRPRNGGRAAERLPAARIASLAALSGIVRDRDLTALAGAARTCAAVERDLQAIDAARAARAATLTGLDAADPAMMAGADARWLALLAARRRDLMLKLALARADREAAKAVALRALGRADILDRLAAARRRPG
jgi:hypothetical protein